MASPVAISLNEAEKEQLQSMTRSRTLPHRLVQPAQIVLACAEGEPHLEIAKRLGISYVTVGKGRPRFHHQGIAGLQDQQALATPTGISKSTVHRWFQLFNRQPHRHRQFKISNDPFFVHQVQDSPSSGKGTRKGGRSPTRNKAADT